jgi:prepilin-type N-terminal cleavage/methylation domain-containing protein
MRIKTNRKSGFTLVEIMIVVAIIGLLAAIAIPNFVKARTTAQKNACINNLRQIDGAKEQYALEARLSENATISDISTVNAFIKGGGPICPAAGASGTTDSSYTYGNVGVNPVCKIDGTNHKLPTTSSGGTTTGGTTGSTTP